MRIAVVIPLYNAAPWIARTIQSVLDQDCKDVRVFVVDDGSTDNSLEEVSRFGDSISVETGPNRGACHARNRGLALAEAHGADFVLFLDSDDYLEGPMLSGMLAEADMHGADIVLSNMHIEYPDGRRILRHLYSGQVSPKAFFRGWMADQAYVNPSGILWRVSFVRRIGGWDESLSRAQDLDITMRAMLHEPLIRKNEAGAAIQVRANPNSISQNGSERALRSRYRAVSGLIQSVRGTSFADMIPFLCAEAYSIARVAFQQGHAALGREILQLLERENYADHPGTRMHSLAARLLGLERKVQIWGS